MTFLPIVVRELRVAARRNSTYRLRFWSVFAAVGYGSYLLLMSRAFLGGLQGKMIFTTLVAVCFLNCLSLTRNTVDCLSEEKREGTLGFLFLTDLKGHDIVLGKLFSRSLISFYSLLGILPVIAVSLLFGGITAAQFWMVNMGLLNAFFFYQCAGIFVSALSRKRNTANFGAAIILLGYTGGLYWLDAVLRATRWGRWVSALDWFNPGYCVFWGLARQSSEYWASLLLVHLHAWLFLAAASWRLPRSWQEKPTLAKARWRDRFQRWQRGHGVSRKLLLDINPFLWLSLRNRLGQAKVWLVLVGVDGFWVWCLLRHHFRDAGPPVLFGIILSNHLLLKMLMASEASGHLEEQRHSGALEFLLSCTPLTVEEILAGQWLALRRQLLRPMIGVLATDAGLMLIVLFRSLPDMDSSDKGNFTLFVLAVMTGNARAQTARHPIMTKM